MDQQDRKETKETDLCMYEKLMGMNNQRWKKMDQLNNDTINWLSIQKTTISITYILPKKVQTGQRPKCMALLEELLLRECNYGFTIINGFLNTM